MTKQVGYLILLASVTFAAGTGCARFDAETVRHEQSISFGEEVESRTKAALSSETPLTLDQCIRIALEHNLDIQAADCTARIARLNRLASFANFLPAVEMNYTSTELNRTPSSSMLGPFAVSVQDRIVRETMVQAQMPVFAPATWFLYDAHRRGEEMGALAADYTRQMIALQVSGLYFQCLALEEAGKALESQRNAAEGLCKDVEAYFREGLAMESDTLQARTLVLARKTDCEKNSRALDEARSGLLEAMGLSPIARFQLEADMPIAPPKGGLEDWILHAMLNHPRLALADRQVALEEDKVKIAITEFLPILAIFSGRNHTTNSKNTFPYMTALGFTGVMTLFDGFANINEYRAARVNREKVYIAREQESLAVMASVYRAHLHLENAKADIALANAALEAASAVLREAESRLHEGLANSSETLEATARRDTAAARAVAATFQEQLAAAVARNVVGDTFRGKEVPKDEQ